MTEPKKIRNAFVVTPEGTIEERTFPDNYSPLVNSLENLHNKLRRAQQKKSS